MARREGRGGGGQTLVWNFPHIFLRETKISHNSKLALEGPFLVPPSLFRKPLFQAEIVSGTTICSQSGVRMITPINHSSPCRGCCRWPWRPHRRGEVTGGVRHDAGLLLLLCHERKLAVCAAQLEAPRPLPVLHLEAEVASQQPGQLV